MSGDYHQTLKQIYIKINNGENVERVGKFKHSMYYIVTNLSDIEIKNSM